MKTFVSRNRSRYLFINYGVFKINKQFFNQLFSFIYLNRKLKILNFMKILIKTFSSKKLLKIYINILRKIFKQFLPKIFLRSLKDLQLKSFGDLWKILSSNLFEIFGRSSSKIFLRSTEDLKKNLIEDLPKIFKKELVMRSS